MIYLCCNHTKGDFISLNTREHKCSECAEIAYYRLPNSEQERYQIRLVQIHRAAQSLSEVSLTLAGKNCEDDLKATLADLRSKQWWLTECVGRVEELVSERQAARQEAEIKEERYQEDRYAQDQEDRLDSQTA